MSSNLINIISTRVILWPLLRLSHSESVKNWYWSLYNTKWQILLYCRLWVLIFLMHQTTLRMNCKISQFTFLEIVPFLIYCQISYPYKPCNCAICKKVVWCWPNKSLVCKFVWQFYWVDNAMVGHTRFSLPMIWCATFQIQGKYIHV